VFAGQLSLILCFVLFAVCLFVFTLLLFMSVLLCNAFSALTLLVGQQEEHPAYKN